MKVRCRIQKVRSVPRLLSGIVTSEFLTTFGLVILIKRIVIKTACSNVWIALIHIVFLIVAKVITLVWDSRQLMSISCLDLRKIDFNINLLYVI